VWTKAKHLITALATAAVLLPTAWAADSDGMTAQPGTLRIALYNNYAPYSNNGKGIDVDLAQAIAKQMGLRAELAWFNADEDMGDDLRNMVWKGHYLGARPGDVMMHVPFDEHLAKANEQVNIIAPYMVETIAVARDPQRIPNKVVGSAAVALEVFTREKVGVETATLADAFLLSSLNGRLREQVAHYKSVALAVKGMEGGEVAAVMAPRGELEAALAGAKTPARFALEGVKMPELKIDNWALGMAVKKDNTALAEAVSKALATLQQNGEVKKIFERHGITLQTPGN